MESSSQRVDGVSNQTQSNQDISKKRKTETSESPIKKQRLSVQEGIRLQDPLISQRSDTCERIYQHLLTENFILLRSPPFSGKTSLGMLMEKYLKDKGLEVIRLSLLLYKSDLESFFEKNTGKTWDDWVGSTSPSIIILDESQMLYELGSSHFFWRSVKSLMQEENPMLRILFLASYGERPTNHRNYSPFTPVTFSNRQHLDLDTVRFTRSECDELFFNYNEDELGKLIPLSNDVKEAIFCATKGHPGLTRLCMSSIVQKFTERAKTEKNILDAELVSFLMSQNFFLTIQSSRSIPTTNLTKNETELLQEIINSFSVEFPDHPELADAARDLIKSGIIARVEGRLEFSAPIVRIVYIQRFYSSPKDSIASSDFVEFIKTCIARMNPHLLKDSFATGKDKKLYERQWQMEFYRASTSALPKDNIVSPDVGRIFNSNGYMDFYVNGLLQWAIEILREGNEGKEHAKRFMVGGLYYVMRDKIKHYAILDFREHDVDKLEDHFWYIIYEKDYSAVTIKRRGETPIHIKLLGHVNNL